MKKKIDILRISLGLIILLCCSLFSFNSLSVYAAEEVDPNPTLGYVIPSGLFEDNRLYVALATEYANKKPAGSEYNNNGKLYEDMFKAAGITTLDLSDGWEIASINDLAFFDLTEVEEIDLSFNNLTREIDLRAFTSLKRINVSNNNITGINITGLTQLEKLILNNNRISNINLSTFNGTAVDLSMNSFISMTDIILPANTGAVSFTIDLINNNITDATSLSAGGVDFNLGIQGITRGIVPESNGRVVFYQLQNSDIKAVITGNGNAYSSTDYTDAIEEVELVPGEYSLQYLYVADESPVFVENEIYTTSTVWKAGYKSFDFVVRPNAPAYALYVGGEVRNNLVKIEDNTELKIDIAEGTSVFISYNGTEWTEYEGGKIKLEKKSQTIYLKAVQNEVSSEVATIVLVYEKQAIPIWLSVVSILLFVGMLIGAYYLVKKYILDRTPGPQE